MSTGDDDDHEANHPHRYLEQPGDIQQSMFKAGALRVSSNRVESKVWEITATFAAETVKTATSSNEMMDIQQAMFTVGAKVACERVASKEWTIKASF